MESGRTKIIRFDSCSDNRGKLVFATVGQQLPFAIQRIFYIYGNENERGGHAHKECEQVLIPICGIIYVNVNNTSYRLENPETGLYIPTYHKVSMTFSPNSVLLVLASREFDPDDYIQ